MEPLRSMPAAAGGGDSGGHCVAESEICVIGPDGGRVHPERANSLSELVPEQTQCGYRLDGITGPSQIQALTWPLALQGKDVIGIGATGTGKTLAFLWPAFANMLKTGHNGPGLLVMCPTKELALQTEAEANRFGEYIGFKAVAMYECAPRQEQIEKYQQLGLRTIVATPPRLLDFLVRGNQRRGRRSGTQVTVCNVSCLVLDEADRLFEMGFKKKIEQILARMRNREQTMLFTATWPDQVRCFAALYMKHPYMIGNWDELQAGKAEEEWGGWTAAGKKKIAAASQAANGDVEAPEAASPGCASLGELGTMGPEKLRQSADHGSPKEGLEGCLSDLGSERAESGLLNEEGIQCGPVITEVEDGLVVDALPAEVDDHRKQADSPTFEEAQQQVDINPEEVDGSASAPVPAKAGEGSMAQGELEEAADGSAAWVSTTVPNVLASNNDAEDSPAAMVHDGLAAARKATAGDGADPARKRLRSKTAVVNSGRPPADVAATPPKRLRLQSKTPAAMTVWGAAPEQLGAENRKKRGLSPSTHAMDAMVSSKCVKVGHSPDRTSRTPRSPAPRSLPSMRTKSPATLLRGLPDVKAPASPRSPPSTPQRRSKRRCKVATGDKVRRVSQTMSEKKNRARSPTKCSGKCNGLKRDGKHCSLNGTHKPTGALFFYCGKHQETWRARERR